MFPSEHSDSFYMSLRPLFLLGQWTGLMPVIGTTGKNHDCLQYKWTFTFFIYFGVLLCTTIFFDYVSTVKNIQDGIRLDNFGSTVFYTSCILNALFFVDISSKLPNLCKTMAGIEETIGKEHYPTHMALKIKILIGWVLILSLVEHSLVTYLGVRGALEVVEEDGTPFIKNFFRIRFNVIMNNIYYNDASAIFLVAVNAICTLNWNYLDLFIACICLEVSSKFNVINYRIRAIQNDESLAWRKVRLEFNDLSTLTKKIDALISKLVLASYASNIYHLSLQLLRSLRFQGDIYAMTYFYFSLAYLIFRTLLVSLISARIPEETKEPISVLFSNKNSCLEVERFLEQVISDDIQITGRKFFAVNKRFILTIIATIVTYEVILLQFDSLQNSA